MKLEPINFTAEQAVSVYQAIFLLEQSDAICAPSAIFHLKQLQERMSKAKIIHRGEQNAK